MQNHNRPSETHSVFTLLLKYPNNGIYANEV